LLAPYAGEIPGTMQSATNSERNSARTSGVRFNFIVNLLDVKKPLKVQRIEHEKRSNMKIKGGRSRPSVYFSYTKWPRRFCCQQLSFDSVQNGFSFP
jgi:hypothetical protein